MKKPGGTARQRAWRQSAELKEIGRSSLRRWNAQRQEAAVCGAKAKSTGAPCQQPALENGRCRVHGGLTPKGSDWHMPRWPAKDSARAAEKLNQKLAALEKRAAKIAARVAAMTPERREKYVAWKRSHKPGSTADREMVRRDRQARESVAELMNRPESISAERKALLDLAGAFDRHLSRITGKDRGNGQS